MTYFADVLSRLSLLPAEIDAERQIIQEERIRSLSGQQRTMYYVLERIAPGSIFGQRIVIGTEETINSVQQADFRDYYGKWYVPSNATLMVVADADPEQVVSLIKKHFGGGSEGPPADSSGRRCEGLRGELCHRGQRSGGADRTDRHHAAGTGAAPTTTSRSCAMTWWRASVSGVQPAPARTKSRPETPVTSTAAFRPAIESGVLYMAEMQGRAKPGKWQQSLEELALELQRGRLYGFTEREIEEEPEGD